MAGEKTTITSVEFRNYKAFEQYSLSLQSMNVLVGANNSGKSTIIGAFRALDVALRRARTRKPEYLSGPKGYRYGYYLTDDSFPISLENVHTDYADSDSTITFHLSNKNKLQLYFPKDGGWILILEPAKKPVKSAAAFKAEFPLSITVVPVLGPVEHKEPLVQVETVQRNLSTHLASRHFRNYWFYFRDDFDKFAELISSSWPGMIVLKPERVDSGSAELSMYCLENRMTRELFWAGFGFQIWCQLITHIHRARDSSLLIVDEPEVYLHPDVQRQLLTMLRHTGADVLLASHSSEIIAEADPSEILLVDKKRRSARRLRDISSVQGVLSQIGSIHNITLTRLAKNRTILFTEGDKDFTILRYFARHFDLTALAAGTDLTPVSSDGFSSKERVEAIRWGLQKTLGQTLAIGVIYDRDFFCSEEIQEILADLRKEVSFAHIHERKEIENYLLVPSALERAMRRAIADRARREGREIVIDEDARQILDRLSSTDKTRLQSQYIGKRSSFLRKTRPDEATITEETIERFEASWASLDSRLGIVAGKTLLGAFRSEVQLKYGITLTDHKIVEAFKLEEIPVDLVRLLHDLDKFRASGRVARASSKST